MDFGRADLAEGYYSRILENTPDDAEALEGRGISRLRLHKYLQAKNDLNRAVTVSVERWRAWNALGIIADLEGEYTIATGHYRKALDILPGYPMLLNNLGYSLIMAHRYIEAERVLRRGLDHAPQDNYLTNNLGISLAWLGRYDESLRVLTGVINPAQAYNNIGYIALLKKDYKLAIEYFRKALEANPTYYVRAARNLQIAEQQLKNQAAPR
jgi:Flp pilus assembly protein TadD